MYFVTTFIYAQKNRTGPPSTNQVVSTSEPRCSHAVFTLRVHALTSPLASYPGSFLWGNYYAIPRRPCVHDKQLENNTVYSGCLVHAPISLDCKKLCA